VPAQRVVQHLLIGTEQRSEEEALARASELLLQARSPGSDFDAMVMEYSEDPGKGSNQGRYTMVQPGQYVPEFEAAGLALQRPGEFAEPVKTQFGYHLMRLVEVTPERTRSFEEVRDELVLKVEEEVAQGARERLVQELKSLPDRGDDERLVGLRARYGGEPAKPAQWRGAARRPSAGGPGSGRPGRGAIMSPFAATAGDAGLGRAGPPPGRPSPSGAFDAAAAPGRPG